MLDQVLKTIDESQNQSVEGLKDFLRIPSVSAKAQHAPDMQRCAQWLAQKLKTLGLWARIEPTVGHPVVLAGTTKRPGLPTVLLYGHYDVQPPEPLNLWTTPAFEPTVRDAAPGIPAVYARGAVDDKGQVWAHVQAIGAWMRHGGLPVNLVMLVEGEEEIGSDNLEKWMREHCADLAADIAVVSDTGQFARGVPAITYGLRGLVYMEVFLTAAAHDLHSGIYGGAVPNPADVLCDLIAALHDARGRVTIPGFYDDVLSLTPVEREMWAKLPFDEGQFARELALPGLSGEEGFTTLERKWARPTCDVNGLTSGYQGEGAKTVIASKASAKISMRLVPNQKPAAIQAAFEKALRARCPGNVKIEFAEHGLGMPVIVPIEGRPTQLAARAVERGFGVAPVFMREGGSIPVVGLIKSVLGLDTLLVGFGLPDDAVHAPNEKFDLDALHKGTRTAAALYQELAGL